MNRINPIYILLLCLTISLVSFSLLFDIKKELLSNTEKLSNFKNTASTFVSLKKDWNNKQEIQKQISNLSNEITSKKAKLLISFEKRVATIKLETSEKKVLNRFVNKLLNKKLKINKLDIRSNYVFVEVSLK